jgi:hypothetical protein
MFAGVAPMCVAVLCVAVSLLGGLLFAAVL